ncbi:hypothetical protein B0H19DRAFT_1373233 [Mycena capillaripes]|nr:hypothetical protein B0H19DRAFT_1373233 [Mycena capillaripes]
MPVFVRAKVRLLFTPHAHPFFRPSISFGWRVLLLRWLSSAFPIHSSISARRSKLVPHFFHFGFWAGRQHRRGASMRALAGLRAPDAVTHAQGRAQFSHRARSINIWTRRCPPSPAASPFSDLVLASTFVLLFDTLPSHCGRRTFHPPSLQQDHAFREHSLTHDQRSHRAGSLRLLSSIRCLLPIASDEDFAFLYFSLAITSLPTRLNFDLDFFFS